MSRRQFSALGGLLILILLVGGVFKYLNSRQSLTINFTNVTNVNIYHTTESEDPGSTTASKPRLVSASGTTLKLAKGSYLLVYTAASGYANGSSAVQLGLTKQVVQITPTYSQAHLDSILNQQIGAITAVLNQKYPNISQYKINHGQLFNNGDWYGTTLTYIGNDPYDADTLRLVMRRVNGSWQVETNPPSIVLSTVNYPDIPKDILSQVNSLN